MSARRTSELIRSMDQALQRDVAMIPDVAEKSDALKVA